MKMNYLLSRNTRFRKKPWSRLLAFFTVVFLLFALFLWRPELVRVPLAALAAPLWRTGNALGERISRVAEYFRFKRTMSAEIERLREGVVERDALLAGYTLTREENKELKALLGRNEKESRILAALLVSPPRTPYDSFVLDAGTEDGVSVGDEVLFGATVLGRVVAVSRSTATAQLFSTPGIATPVVIWRGGLALPAEAVGEGNGAFRLTVPRGAGVAVGDTVVMPGINPAQFGEVAAVETSETDSFATAFARNPVNVSLLRFLEIRSNSRSL
jgi:rod shape-determining protein MreC